MKKKFFTIVILLCSTLSYGQNNQSNDVSTDFQQLTDSLSEDQKELLFTLAEDFMLSAVDSVMNEGMYMQALDLLDSVQVNWKKVTGMEPSAKMYLRKGNILMSLEEWSELIKTTEECINIHKEDIQDRVAAIIYSMQGSAYRNIENYKSAIRSYEYAISRYNRVGDIGSQGDMMCSMAYCYDHIGKQSMASTFYEKGFNKFIEYFNTTRSTLLRGNFNVSDPYKQTVLGVFSSHLYGMAVHEQDCGDRLSSKEYLKMSANCGNSQAKSEYNRIYGY